MDVDETRLSGEPAGEYVLRVARLKADAAAARFPERIVLAADTAVVADDDVFGVSTDAADAARTPRALAGRPHRAHGSGHSGTGQIRDLRGSHDGVVLAAIGGRYRLVCCAVLFAQGRGLCRSGPCVTLRDAHRRVLRNVVGLPVASVARVLGELAVPDSGTAESPPHPSDWLVVAPFSIRPYPD